LKLNGKFNWANDAKSKGLVEGEWTTIGIGDMKYLEWIVCYMDSQKKK
jgi:hypothetical protein